MSQPTLMPEPEEQQGVTLRTVWDLYNQVSSELLGHMDPPVGENGRPHWRASMNGYCLRRQYMWRQGVPDTRAETEEQCIDKERRFAAGNRVERELVDAIELAGVLIARQVSLSDPELHVTGSADVLWGGAVQRELPDRSKWWDPDYTWAIRELRARADRLVGVPLPLTLTEIKSTHSYAVRKMYKEGPRFDFRCQAGTYWLMASDHPEQLPSGGLDRVEIAVVGRDAVKPLIFGVTRRDVDLARSRLEALNKAWDERKPPPCTCGQEAGMSWEQGYCPYLDPEDPSRCCGMGLLDRLTASVEATRR